MNCVPYTVYRTLPYSSLCYSISLPHGVQLLPTSPTRLAKRTSSKAKASDGKTHDTSLAVYGLNSFLVCAECCECSVNQPGSSLRSLYCMDTFPLSSCASRPLVTHFGINDFRIFTLLSHRGAAVTSACAHPCKLVGSFGIHATDCALRIRIVSSISFRWRSARNSEMSSSSFDTIPTLTHRQ